MQRTGTLENSPEKKQMRGNYFIDTNSLVYLVSKEDEKKHTQIKEIISTKNSNFFISIQNLKEFANISLKKSDKSIEKINSTMEKLMKKFNLLIELNDDIFYAVTIAKRKNFYDALLVATMKRNGIKKIITENEKDFLEFKGIKTINPFR